MRALLLSLVLVNVAWFAWAAWLAPADPEASVSPPPDVPRLALASEVAVPEPPRAPAARAQSIARRDGTASCRSIGPFDTADESRRAATAFTASGYLASPRSEDTRRAEGWWVSLPPAASPQAETQLLSRLARSGITDASVLPDAAGRRISVGVFSDADRAERRAVQVRRLGLAPDVTERVRVGTTYWVDLQLRTPEELAEAESFNRDGSSQLELKPCP